MGILIDSVDHRIEKVQLYRAQGMVSCRNGDLRPPGDV